MGSNFGRRVEWAGDRNVDTVPIPDRRSSAPVLALATAAGVAAFLYPFVLPGIQQLTNSGDSAHATLAPFIFIGVVGIVLVVAISTLGSGGSSAQRSREIALLGVLVAIDATMRLVPTLAGASPVFLLIMLVGMVFGSSIGFQMGALTLLLSAFITGGIGPWLPFQMLVSAWVGMTAGWLPRNGTIRKRIFYLTIFGAVWGFLFGALMNLWFWPFTAPGVQAEASLYWQPGLPLGETLQRYARFYITTSLLFDAFRAVGNVIFIILLGAPVLRLLERYRSRFVWQPWQAAD